MLTQNNKMFVVYDVGWTYRMFESMQQIAYTNKKAYERGHITFEDVKWVCDRLERANAYLESRMLRRVSNELERATRPVQTVESLVA